MTFVRKARGGPWTIEQDMSLLNQYAHDVRQVDLVIEGRTNIACVSRMNHVLHVYGLVLPRRQAGKPSRLFRKDAPSLAYDHKDADITVNSDGPDPLLAALVREHGDG